MILLSCFRDKRSSVTRCSWSCGWSSWSICSSLFGTFTGRPSGGVGEVMIGKPINQSFRSLARLNLKQCCESVIIYSRSGSSYDIKSSRSRSRFIQAYLETKKIRYLKINFKEETSNYILYAIFNFTQEKILFSTFLKVLVLYCTVSINGTGTGRYLIYPLFHSCRNRIRNKWFRFRIHDKVPDPTGSGFKTLI